MDLSSLVWTDWAAVIGASTGIVALLIQFFHYMHSKPRLRVEIKPECIILMDEFKVQDKVNPDNCAYKAATHIVITNVGQMPAVVLNAELYAKNCRSYHFFLRKIIPFYKKHCIEISHGAGTIVKQSSKPPFILDSGHVWIGIINADSYREALDRFPYVYFKIKASHKKQIIRKRIKLVA